jgi:hypothetical protein
MIEPKPEEILKKLCPFTPCFLGSIGECGILKEWKKSHKVLFQGSYYYSRKAGDVK